MSRKKLPIDQHLSIGFDVGGTKICMLSEMEGEVRRYKTADFASVEEMLDTCFEELGSQPSSVVLAMAGPRDDETGSVKLTNGNWPAFHPASASQRYPGTVFETVNDMVGTAAGVLVEPGVDLTELKPGTPTREGTKLVVALSTGFGAAAAVWDKHVGQHVFVPSEVGHIGIQPENDDEAAYLRFLQTQHVHVSAELALAGKSGLDSLINHTLADHPADKLATAVSHARTANLPVGAVLLEFATQGTGPERATSRLILQRLGAMLGSALRDLAVAFRATGGIYLTGSYILAVGQYLSDETDLLQRFVHPGAVHEEWIAKIPLYLVDDPHVAVKGALQLAERRATISDRTLTDKH